MATDTTIPREAPRRAALVLSDAEIHERVARYTATRDERAVMEVMAHFEPRLERTAHALVRQSGRDPGRDTDATDALAAAGKLAILKAMEDYRSETGVPFGGYVTQRVRSAMAEELASLTGGTFTFSRKQLDERNTVLAIYHRVLHERATRERTTTAGASRPAGRREPLAAFTLGGDFTDADLAVLRSRGAVDAAEMAARRAAVLKLLDRVDGHLAAALPNDVPAADRAQLAHAQIVKAVKVAPGARTALEKALHDQLTYAVTTVTRRGGIATAAADQAAERELYEEVARRAGVSARTVATVIRTDNRAVSVDEVAPDTGRGRASAAGKTIADPRSVDRDVAAVEAEAHAVNVAAVRDAVMQLEPRDRGLFVLAYGLDGQPAVAQVVIAESLGLDARTVKTSVDRARKEINRIIREGAGRETTYGREATQRVSATGREAEAANIFAYWQRARTESAEAATVPDEDGQFAMPLWSPSDRARTTLSATLPARKPSR